MLKGSSPVFAVSHVLETMAYYRDVLGFSPVGRGSPTLGCVELGGARIHFELDPELAARMVGATHRLESSNIDALHELHRSTGAIIVAPLKNDARGTCEYTLRDLNGYRLHISGRQKGEKVSDRVAALEADVRLVIELPAIEQYVDLFECVGWGVDRARMLTALDGTVFGVLALDTSGAPVGMTRVTGDGMYFTLWDVIVRPSRQRHGVGAALIERALSELRERVGPGVFVGLFTGRHAFYERLGFTTGLAMHRPL